MNSHLVFSSYNQTEKHICFGTNMGFYIYQVNPFKKLISRKVDGGVSIVKMVYESNIVLFVGRHGSILYPDNRLIIWDDSKKKVMGEISYNSPIVNIDVTKNYILVSTDKKIYIYEFYTLLLVRSIDTIYNPRGCMASSIDINGNLFYPSNNLGSISIININNEEVREIDAHANAIDNLLLSRDGNYLVTTSEKGTIIRIFNTYNLVKINEFRRGTEPSKIVDIALNYNSSILLVASEKGTIHLFNTEIDNHCTIPNSTFSFGFLNYALPSYFQSKWSFAQFYLKGVITKSIFDYDTYKIYTIGDDGQFYILNYENLENNYIEKTIKYISDIDDPFGERSSTIR
jgi:WD40 repeat protein